MDNLNDIQDASLAQSVALTFKNLIISHPELLFFIFIFLFFAKGGHHQCDVCLFSLIRPKLKLCLEGQHYEG